MSKENIIRTIVRNCDRCGNEDSIDCVTGLCLSCRQKDCKHEYKKLNEKEYGHKNCFVCELCGHIKGQIK